MTRSDLYKQRSEQFLAEQANQQQRIYRIGSIRLLLFVVMIICLLQLFSSNFEQMLWWWSFVAMVPVFIYFIRKHQQHFDAKQLVDALIEINQKELKLQTEQHSDFDGGSQFADPNHAYAGDLDLFGEQGFFSVINRTSTAKGVVALADLLKHPLKDTDSIYEQQKAVQALAPLIEFRQNFMANGHIVKDTLEDMEYLQAWADRPANFLPSLFWRSVRIVGPLLGIAALAYFLATFNYVPLLLVMGINFVFLGLKNQYVNKEHTIIGERQSILSMYIALLSLATEQDLGEVDQLATIQEKANNAQKAFKQLSTIVDYFDQRLNVFVGLGLNLLFLYDVQCLFALEKWKKAYHSSLSTWLGAVAELDILVSLGTFYFNYPGFTFPQLEKSEQIKIQAKALGHPLIPSTMRVDNDVILGPQHQVFIVTGSNMAGKSTFLRAVAINLLLAQCGAPVCAQSFSCSLMDIMTSMRVQDSINKQTSYFQAELLRLQQLMRQLEQGNPSFVILDEILKGTNSEDKLLGSELLVQHFLSFNCLAMIATHDLELGKMETAFPEKIQNLCFESIIENDELHFDYRLNKGIAKNKNATFLLYKMEIVPREA